jgi:quercetin dioxygenase-like cupin family protein
MRIQMVYVLRGWMKTEFEGVGARTLEAGDCMYQKPGIRHRVVDYAPDLEVLEITIPADFDTETTAP